MTNRLPLVRDTGKTRQMASGDSLLLPGSVEYATVPTLAVGTEVDLLTAGANTVIISGSGVSISSFGSTGGSGRVRKVWFNGVNTLVNGASLGGLQLPTGANITTAAGDFAEFTSLSGNLWYCSQYLRADGTALAVAADPTALKLDGSTVMSGAVENAPVVTVAAATTITLRTAGANTIIVTGAGVTISSFDSPGSTGRERRVWFQGVNTLVHSYSAIALPGGANITTASGDFAEFVVLSGNVWYCTNYQRADGTALVTAAPSGVLKLDGSTTMTGAVNEAPIVSMTAAATVDIGAAAANTISLGGIATITSLGTPASAGLRRTLLLTAQTLVHDTNYLILPGSANITAQSGDSADFVSTVGGGWKCTRYSRNTGTPLVPYWPGGTVTAAINDAAEASVASSATCAIGAAASSNVLIGGTNTITAFDTMTVGGARRVVRFGSSLTLTHDATKLILPGATSIQTAANDFAEFECMDGTNWRCLWYTRANGNPVVGDTGKLSLTGGTMSGAINEAPIVSVSSETSPCPIGAAAANTIQITSTANISTFDNAAIGTKRTLLFTNACTLVNGTAIVLPTGANIVTAVGDTAEFVSTGTSIWKCTRYDQFSGAPLASASDSSKLPLAGGTLSGALNLAPEVTLASAATLAIGAAAANTINVTGTTAVTAFDTIASGARRVLVFAGALTLTYSATALILPTAASITTAAGDTAEFESLGSGKWKCLWYQRASGKPAAFAYDRSNVLAAVSQASGVPTGGLIESGSNSNGTYAKFADGTMICVKNVSVPGGSPTAKGALYTSAVTAAGNHAAQFSSVPTVLASGTDGAGGGWPAMEVFSDSTQAGSWSLRNTAANSSAGYIYLVAFGRWFT